MLTRLKQFWAEEDGWLPIAIGIASIGLSAIGAAKSAKSDKQAAKFQKKVGEKNAEIARYNQADALKVGTRRVADGFTMKDQAVGAVRAAVAAQGVIVDEIGATSGDMVIDMAAAGWHDIMAIKRAAEAEIKGFQDDEMMFEMGAENANRTANSINPFLSGATAGLGALAASPWRGDILGSVGVGQ